MQLQIGDRMTDSTVGLMGLDTQGRVWYGELSPAKSPARYSIKWTTIEERQ